ncbi:MAG: hypothetical protein R2698_04740 [Microthrixaceae bacterium]
MRNHNEKARDMARSVLPSTARKGARSMRAHIHGRERAHERQLLRDLRDCPDPDDYDAWLGLSDDHRRDVADMVQNRRSADKVGPLLRWAERTVERRVDLAGASPADREVYFRKILPPGLIGNHAITHLRWMLDDRSRVWFRRSGRASAAETLAQLVGEIVAAGSHGELNRRIRSTVLPFTVRTVRLPPERLIDDEHPSPGVLLPYRNVIEQRPRHVRFLAGAHDIEAFADDACAEITRVVREFHAELFGVGSKYAPS